MFLRQCLCIVILPVRWDSGRGPVRSGYKGRRDTPNLVSPLTFLQWIVLVKGHRHLPSEVLNERKGCAKTHRHRNKSCPCYPGPSSRKTLPSTHPKRHYADRTHYYRVGSPSFHSFILPRTLVDELGMGSQGRVTLLRRPTRARPLLSSDFGPTPLHGPQSLLLPTPDRPLRRKFRPSPSSKTVSRTLFRPVLSRYRCYSPTGGLP